MNTEEQNYLSLMDKILNKGIVDNQDRTGVGTKYLFGENLRFSMRDQFLLLTTKKVFFKGVFEELKLFLRGDTNTKNLERKKVNIWKGNTSREFLDKRGLDYLPEGEIGCGYPHQWRNFGGEHPLIPETKESKGFDQIKKIIDQLKNNPFSRRIYLTGLNPRQEAVSAIPACHCLAFWDVNPSSNELNCMLVMRSNDMFLGFPFNIAQYNLLTLYFCQLTGLKPGDLVYSCANTHIYLNHVEQTKKQLKREPRPFPQIKFNKEIKNLDDICNLEYKDLSILNYNPYPRIKAPMAI